ncbi:MAG: adhesion lipoprotein [Phycisphaerae bacterium]|nr:adhesion lipoprotein [Phycisphaerae bacterium]
MRIDRRVALFVLLLPTLLAPVACDSESGPDAAAPNRIPTVVPTNYPMMFFIERIAGDRVTIEWIVPDGVDPGTWQPTADEVAEMNSADLVVLNGAGYEPWLETVSLSPGAIVDTSAGFKDRLIEVRSRVHSHGPDGSHSHTGTATHTWLDPDLAIKQADAVRGALAELLPNEQDAFQSNFGALRRELLLRSAGMEQAVNTRPTTPVVFSHPVFQYLQRRYRMNGVSVHFEPRREPDDDAIRELDSVLASQPAAWFIWEGPPIPANEELVGAKGLQGVVFDPGGAPPESGDLLDILDAGVASLRLVYDAPADS